MPKQIDKPTPKDTDAGLLKILELVGLGKTGKKLKKRKDVINIGTKKAGE